MFWNFVNFAEVQLCCLSTCSWSTCSNTDHPSLLRTCGFTATSPNNSYLPLHAIPFYKKRVCKKRPIKFFNHKKQQPTEYNRIENVRFLGTVSPIKEIQIMLRLFLAQPVQASSSQFFFYHSTSDVAKC